MPPRRVATLLAASTLLAVALAGCLDAPDPVGQDRGAAPLVDALAAWAAGEPSANVHLFGEWRNGASAEVDAWGDYLFVMRGGGVDILDVSDPMDPKEVSRVTGIPRVLDVKVSHDGNWLFVGDDQRASAAPLGGIGPLTGGIYVVDVSDKTTPRIASYQPVGPERGPHMVYYHRTAAGDELVFGANADVSIHRFDPESGTLTELARYRPDLVTGYNREPHVVQALYYAWAHDMFVMDDPVTGQTLMYVANWDAGLRIVDVSDPASPVELGSWMDYPQDHTGNLHTVATDWIGDRRITVGAVEVGFAVVGGLHYALGTEKGILYVWDTTDLASPVLLGTWENPDGASMGRDHVPGEEITSTHNLQLEDGRVYLAHYTLGVFVLDVSTPETQAAPEVLAYYREPGMNTWDVVLAGGVMFTSGAEGVLALHYARDVVGEAGITSRA